MASIGSLSSGTSANLYGASIKGFTGLASGIDVDSMIEKMTYGTRQKIEKQMEDRQKLVWKQDAYRSVSSKLIDFNNKFLSFSASNSLNRVSTFARSIITSQGKYSSNISVSGASPALDNLKIHSVDQLATNSNLTGKNDATSDVLSTGSLKLGDNVSVQNLGDTYLEFKYGGKTYSAFLDSGKDYSDGTKAAASINEVLKTIDTADHAKLGDKVKIQFDTASNQFSFVDLQEHHDNKIALSGGAAAAITALGMTGADFNSDNNIGGAGTLSGSAVTTGDLVTDTAFSDYVAGKQLYFSYNGVSKFITLPPKAETPGGANDPYSSIENLSKSIQTAINDTFGENTIKVGFEKASSDPTEKTGKLKFSADASSIVRVTGGGTGLLGTSGALQMQVGDGNRLNLDGKIENTVLNGSPDGSVSANPPAFATFLDKDGKEVEELALSINGVRIEGLKKDSTMRDMIQAINDSKAGVKISYMETANKFTITATNGGTAGRIHFDATVTDKDGNVHNNYAKALFSGTRDTDINEGQNAKMTVSYGDSSELITVERNSNSFKFEGSSFTLNGLFSAGSAADSVTFTSKPDTENVTKKVKEMVDAYNDLIDEVYKQSSTKPNRDYKPLTDQQKAKMTESEIKSYEDKAKEGLLFNDSDLSGIANKMRYVFSGVTNVKALEDMGLRVSTSYSEHGKITFDEEKFKAAMDQNSDAVQKLFTGTVDGNGQDGFMARMVGVYDTYARTEGFVKGSLIVRAGSPASATSLLENSIQKQIDGIDTDVKGLRKKLQSEIDRYNSQFTQLEKLVAQMNSQSSALSSFM